MIDQKEIDRLLSSSEEELLMRWYDEEMKRRMNAGVGDVVGVIGDLHEAFINWCREQNLVELLCQKWNYAEKKKKYQTPAQLFGAVSDYLIGQLGFPPTMTVIVLLVQWAGDELCDCA